MRIRVSDSVIAVIEANIFEDDPTTVVYTAEQGIFIAQYSTKELAQKALSKMLTFGYVWVDNPDEHIVLHYIPFEEICDEE